METHRVAAFLHGALRRVTGESRYKYKKLEAVALLPQLGDRLGSRQDPAEFRIEVRRRDPSKLVSGDRTRHG